MAHRMIVPMRGRIGRFQAYRRFVEKLVCDTVDRERDLVPMIRIEMAQRAKGTLQFLIRQARHLAPQICDQWDHLTMMPPPHISFYVLVDEGLYVRHSGTALLQVFIQTHV